MYNSICEGKCEPGESQMNAAIRETEEETGLTTNQLHLIPEFKVELNVKHIRKNCLYNK